MPFEDKIIDAGLGFLSGIGSPDNSQNWNADNWGWWLEKDPASHPAGNFLIWLNANPTFLRTYPEKVPIVISRLTKEGFGSQIHAILQSQLIEQPTQAQNAVFSTYSPRGGQVINTATPTAESVALQNAANANSAKSNTTFIIIGVILVIGVIVTVVLTRRKK